MREIEEPCAAVVREHRLVAHVADAEQRIVRDHRARERGGREALAAAALVAAAAQPVQEGLRHRPGEKSEPGEAGEGEQRKQPQTPPGEGPHFRGLRAEDEEEHRAHAGGEDRADPGGEQDAAETGAGAADAREAQRGHVTEQQHETDGIADRTKATHFPALDALHFADGDPVARAEKIDELNRRERGQRGE